MFDLNKIIFCGIYFEDSEYVRISEYLIKNRVPVDNIYYYKVIEKDEHSVNYTKINHIIETTKNNPDKLIIYINCNIHFQTYLREFMFKIYNILFTCDIVFMAFKNKLIKNTHQKNKKYKCNINTDMIIYYSGKKILENLNLIANYMKDNKINDQTAINELLFNKKCNLTYSLINTKNKYFLHL